MSELPPKTRAWTAEPLSPEVKQSVERLARLEDVARVALMPDVHLAESVCVGAVVATRGQLLPDAVGGDIGGGMAAVQLDCHRGVLDRHATGRILAAFNQAIPATRHRQRRPLPEAPATRTMSHPSLQKVLTQQVHSAGLPRQWEPLPEALGGGVGGALAHGAFGLSLREPARARRQCHRSVLGIAISMASVSKISCAPRGTRL